MLLIWIYGGYSCDLYTVSVAALCVPPAEDEPLLYYRCGLNLLTVRQCFKLKGTSGSLVAELRGDVWGTRCSINKGCLLESAPLIKMINSCSSGCDTRPHPHTAHSHNWLKTLFLTERMQQEAKQGKEREEGLEAWLPPLQNSEIFASWWNASSYLR